MLFSRECTVRQAVQRLPTLVDFMLSGNEITILYREQPDHQTPSLKVGNKEEQLKTAFVQTPDGA